ncbi:hypothetical protein F7725_022183 [Dissostichus mawsoni]|uniref:Uncharacterized protein n=1 Tax=Dissostichus mawsoni TaxID=36200 RepID=A0A7J5ZD83_DISMA|nr:hypothetical protein F7725_022183 [Dissostichus mawsoni]
MERSDLQENVTAYAAQISGGTRPIIVQFENASELKVKELKVKELKVKELKVNASLHGLCYSVSLLLRDGPDGCNDDVCVFRASPRAQRAHLGLQRVSRDRLVFQLQPPGGSVFSRVNISYSEGAEPRYMLHWLPGVCYRNITFMLISEATISQHALLSHSDVTHTPLHHRTGTTLSIPPLNISHKIVHLVQRPLQKDPPAPSRGGVLNPPNEGRGLIHRRKRNKRKEEEEFVNAVVSEYEDSGSAMMLPPPDPPAVFPPRCPPS